MARMSRTTIMADDALLDELREIAEEEGISLGEVIRQGLEWRASTCRRVPSFIGKLPIAVRRGHAADTSRRQRGADHGAAARTTDPGDGRPTGNVPRSETLVVETQRSLRRGRARHRSRRCGSTPSSGSTVAMPGTGDGGARLARTQRGGLRAQRRRSLPHPRRVGARGQPRCGGLRAATRRLVERYDGPPPQPRRRLGDRRSPRRMEQDTIATLDRAALLGRRTARTSTRSPRPLTPPGRRLRTLGSVETSLPVADRPRRPEWMKVRAPSQDSQFFDVKKLLQGASLDDRVRGGALPERRRVLGAPDGDLHAARRRLHPQVPATATSRTGKPGAVDPHEPRAGRRGRRRSACATWSSPRSTATTSPTAARRTSPPPPRRSSAACPTAPSRC